MSGSPETSDPWKQYQMVGIPDGLGAYASGFNRITVFMNHEFGTNTTLSEPVIGDPLNRGAFVSKLILDRAGNVLSAERAYARRLPRRHLVGPAAAAGNADAWLCPLLFRHSLAGPELGFDRQIYFANEETSAPGTFDGLGGLSVAILR